MRISGGVHRSRQLAAPRGATTRPTSDRVREALFSILETRGAIVGARVLDLYAGTGALGLEAISRGALHATFVESDRRALEALAHNIESLRERARGRVVPTSITRALKTLADLEASLVFCDPPYAEVASGAVAKLFETAATTTKIFAPDATIVIEHASRDTPPSVTNFRETDRRTYGDTMLTFYVYTRAQS